MGYERINMKVPWYDKISSAAHIPCLFHLLTRVWTALTGVESEGFGP